MTQLPITARAILCNRVPQFRESVRSDGSSVASAVH